MSNPYLPKEPKKPRPRVPVGERKPTTIQVVLWVVVGGFGAFEIIQGIIGLANK
jgi:hypothetical protein